MKQHGTPKVRPYQLEPIVLVGSLLGLKTAALIARLEPIAALFEDELALVVSGGFDQVQAATTVKRDAAAGLCGAWLDDLPGDELRMEVGEQACTAWSDEAALPAHAPALLHELGGELARVGYDGTIWTYVVEYTHETEAQTAAAIERVRAVAEQLGTTTASRNVGGNLMKSYARGMPSRAWIQTRGGTLEPRLGLQWDRVEWMPIQSMLRGFYPQGDGVAKILRLSKGVEVEDATVDLVLGRVDPPTMRIAITLKSSPLRGT